MDDTLEKAITYYSNRLSDEPNINKQELLEKTSQEFNLTPVQEEFILNKFVLGL